VKPKLITNDAQHGSVDSVGMNVIGGANTFISTGIPENAVAGVNLRNLSSDRIWPSAWLRGTVGVQ
jgi:hypothetical protein